MEPTLDVTSLYNRRAVHRWERTSVGDLLERVTWSYPDKEALVAAPGACADPRLSRLTYRQADQLANQVADGLLARGLTRGDIVMLFCENSAEGILLKLGAAKAGLVCAGQPDDGSGHDRGHDRPGHAQARRGGRGTVAASGKAVRRTGPRGGGHRHHRRRPGPRERQLHRLHGRPEYQRTGRGDPRRRHLGDPVHLGHDRPAQGGDDLPHLLLHGRPGICPVADPGAADRERPAPVHLPADALPRRRPAVPVLDLPVGRHPGDRPAAGCGGDHPLRCR
jgi:AMP-binding enzyme